MGDDLKKVRDAKLKQINELKSCMEEIKELLARDIIHSKQDFVNLCHYALIITKKFHDHLEREVWFHDKAVSFIDQ